MSGIRPVTQWPKLLAGPMVRRVTMQRAHVWICTRMACEAQLVVYSGRVAHDPGPPLETGPRVALDRFGSRMFMTVLSVNLPSSLQPGDVLSYDVRLFEGSVESGLFALGLLGGAQADVGAQYDERRAEVPLGYAPGMLPSFALPGGAPGALTVIHGSCRKPHGGDGDADEPDALQIVDGTIAGIVAGTSTGPRPQQLILTGDQIYADDVAAGLLAALTEAGSELLGWQEDLPLASGLFSFLVDPGWRTRYLATSGVDLLEIPDDGVVDNSQSHLLRFGEWCAMYLFAWSDALWAVDANGDYDLPKPPSAIPLDTLESALEAADQIGLIVMPARAARILQVAIWLDDFRKATRKHWEETRPQALRFAKAVRAGRRALANVATYTMFDDHEITDDWHLNQRVHDRLKGVGATGEHAKVGPRLLRNGLASYALFQHWGNVPDDFAPGTRGRELQDMLHVTAATSGCRLTGEPRAADTLLGLTPGDSPIPASGLRADFGRLRWDYAIEFPCHRIVALDTRTWRFFPPGTPLSWSSLAPLIPAPPGMAANAGADQLTAIAAAWRSAGSAGSALVMESFAELIDAYVALANDAAAARATVESRFTALVTAFDAFVERIPGRVALDPAERLDPVAWDPLTWLQDPARVTEALARFPGLPELRNAIRDVLDGLVDFDYGATSEPLSLLIQALGDFVDTAFLRSAVGMSFAAQRAARQAGEQLWAILSDASAASMPTDLRTGMAAALAALDDLTQTVGVDRLAGAFFRDGNPRLGAGLIRADALPFMVAGPLRTVGPSSAITLLLSPAPIFGNRLVELAQRVKVIQLVAQGTAGEEEMDFEAWSVNVPAMIDLFEAVAKAGVQCCVVLSGDVHYAGSSVHDVTYPGVRTRYLQLTSSASRNASKMTKNLGRLDDLLYDPAGRVFFMQADWRSILAAGSSPLAHLSRLARAEVDNALESVRDAVDPVRQYENLVAWWNSDSITLDDVLETTERVVTAPIGTVRAVTTEAAWQLMHSIGEIRKFADDPVLAVFSDFLTAGPALREQLHVFYEAVGLDAASGLRVDSTVLRDQRTNRLTLYPAAGRFTTGTATFDSVNDWYRRTVGNANVGIVGFAAGGRGITEVHHEIRWYPAKKPARAIDPVTSEFIDPVPRTDWIGTLHRAGWLGVSADIGRHRPTPPTASVPR